MWYFYIKLFKELSNCIPQWLYHFIFPPKMYEGSNVSTSLLMLFSFFFFFLNCSHPSEWYFMASTVFTSIFLITNNVEHFFTYLLALYISSLQEFVCWILCPFFKKYLFPWLCPVLFMALGIFSWGMWEPWPPALEAQNHSHWTTRKVPILWPF